MKVRKNKLVYDFPGTVRGGTPREISVKELRRRADAKEPMFNPDWLPEGLVYQTNRLITLPGNATRILFITRFRVRTIFKGELVEGVARCYAPVGRYGEPSFLVVLYAKKHTAQRWVPAEAVEVIGDDGREFGADQLRDKIADLRDRYQQMG